MFVNKYSSSFGAFGLGIALYGRMSRPSNLSIVFLAKVSYVLGCKSSTLVVWTVELYLSFLFY